MKGRATTLHNNVVRCSDLRRRGDSLGRNWKKKLVSISSRSMKGCDVHAVLFDRRPRGALERLTKVCLFPSQGCDEEEDAMERERASTTARYRGREFHDRVQRATYLPPLLGHDDGGGGMPLSLSSIRTVHLLRERSSRAFAIGRCTAASRRARRRASPRRQAGRLGVATPPSVLLPT